MIKIPLLEACLVMMEEIGESFSTGVTFFVNGSIISGNLIHPIAYYKAVLEMAESAIGDSESTKIAEHLSGVVRESLLNTNRTLNQPVDSDNGTVMEVVYLKNLRLNALPNDKSFGNAFLALRIDSIDGFVLGRPLGEL